VQSDLRFAAQARGNPGANVKFAALAQPKACSAASQEASTDTGKL
jgi:hypothetical protein